MLCHQPVEYGSKRTSEKNKFSQPLLTKFMFVALDFFQVTFFSFEVLHRINNTTPPFLMLDFLRMGDTHELIRVKDSWSGSNENWFYTQTFPSNIYIHQKRASRQKVSRAPKSRQCISQIRTIGGCTNSTTKNIRLTIQITENVSVGQLSWSWNWQDERG